MALSQELNTETVTIRGRTLVLRELSISEWDDIEKKSTRTEKDPITGLEVQHPDDKAQSRLMLAKCIVSAEPGLPAGGPADLGFREVLAINTVINRLHYGDQDPVTGLRDALATELKAKADEQAAEKGKAKGNA